MGQPPTKGGYHGIRSQTGADVCSRFRSGRSAVSPLPLLHPHRLHGGRVWHLLAAAGDMCGGSGRPQGDAVRQDPTRATWNDAQQPGVGLLLIVGSSVLFWGTVAYFIWG